MSSQLQKVRLTNPYSDHETVISTSSLWNISSHHLVLGCMKTNLDCNFELVLLSSTSVLGTRALTCTRSFLPTALPGTSL
ncbi:hypothetical protein DPEC_G00305300 [Dallia pectoralis]|uniref:Uncharacterized protein n=1 Tax=Dallia pectoralis TaxID=75939 RepID=A0ACC2FE51_DALPE|nr:hypothetical protein DPEC_G00305300 [Dallia pectoralis]